MGPDHPVRVASGDCMCDFVSRWVQINLNVKFIYCSSLFKLEKCAEVKYDSLNIMSTKSLNTFGNDFGMDIFLCMVLLQHYTVRDRHKTHSSRFRNNSWGQRICPLNHTRVFLPQNEWHMTYTKLSWPKLKKDLPLLDFLDFLLSPDLELKATAGALLIELKPSVCRH